MPMTNLFDKARVTGFIEPGENAGWLIDTITAEEDANLPGFGSIIRTGRGSVKPGETYTRLFRKVRQGTRNPGRLIVMSDTPDEMRDLFPVLTTARGRVLVNGLGLGCVIRGLLTNDDIEHIDVVEISPDLIELIGPYYDDPRVTIHEGDAATFEWPKGTRWNYAWHDVWDELTTDNLNESSNGLARPCSYERLHRKYGGRVDLQASWGWDYLRRQR